MTKQKQHQNSIAGEMQETIIKKIPNFYNDASNMFSLNQLQSHHLCSASQALNSIFFELLSIFFKISFSALSKQWAGFILSFWAGFICSSSCQIEDSSKWGQNKTSGSSLAQIFIRVSEMFPETTLQPWQVLGSNRGLTTGQLWAVEGRQR